MYTIVHAPCHLYIRCFLWVSCSILTQTICSSPSCARCPCIKRPRLIWRPVKTQDVVSDCLSAWQDGAGNADRVLRARSQGLVWCLAPLDWNHWPRLFNERQQRRKWFKRSNDGLKHPETVFVRWWFQKLTWWHGHASLRSWRPQFFVVSGLLPFIWWALPFFDPSSRGFVWSNPCKSHPHYMIPPRDIRWHPHITSLDPNLSPDDCDSSEYLKFFPD